MTDHYCCSSITSSTTLTIGSVNGSFSVTTVASDTAPDAFSFDSQSDVPLSTFLVSPATVIVSGINTATPVGIIGGEYSLDGSAFTSAAGSISNGQCVQVRLTSSASTDIATSATLTIGGISADFCVTTTTADTTPPVISLNGESPLLLFQGETYVEAGATANDDVDGTVIHMSVGL